MEAKKESKGKYIRFGILIFLWLLLIGGLSYAYFSLLFNNEEKTNTNIVSGLLDIDFETGQYIDNSSMWPIDDSDIFSSGEKSTFSVTRSAENTVENVYYNITLEDIIITDNYSQSNDIKWRLYDVTNPTSSDTPISSGTFSGVNSSSSIQLNNQLISLPENVTHNYSLFIWISNSTTINQTELLNGSLEGKLMVTAVTQ